MAISFVQNVYPFKGVDPNYPYVTNSEYIAEETSDGYKSQKEINADLYSKINQGVSTPFEYKGSVRNFAALVAITDPAVGDMYNVEEAGFFDGTSAGQGKLYPTDTNFVWVNESTNLSDSAIIPAHWESYGGAIPYAGSSTAGIVRVPVNSGLSINSNNGDLKIDIDSKSPLVITNGKLNLPIGLGLSTNAGLSLKEASNTQLGGVIVGSGLQTTNDGTLYINLGTDSGLSNLDGTLKLSSNVVKIGSNTGFQAEYVGWNSTNLNNIVNDIGPNIELSSKLKDGIYVGTQYTNNNNILSITPAVIIGKDTEYPAIINASGLEIDKPDDTSSSITIATSSLNSIPRTYKNTAYLSGLKIKTLSQSPLYLGTMQDLTSSNSDALLCEYGLGLKVDSTYFKFIEGDDGKWQLTLSDNVINSLGVAIQ